VGGDEKRAATILSFGMLLTLGCPSLGIACGSELVAFLCAGGEGMGARTSAWSRAFSQRLISREQLSTFVTFLLCAVAWYKSTWLAQPTQLDKLERAAVASSEAPLRTLLRQLGSMGAGGAKATSAHERRCSIFAGLEASE